MTQKEFDGYKNSLCKHILKKPTTMKKKADMYEHDIFVENYNFNRMQSEVDNLMSITLDDVAEFYTVRCLENLFKLSNNIHFIIFIEQNKPKWKQKTQVDCTY